MIDDVILLKVGCVLPISVFCVFFKFCLQGNMVESTEIIKEEPVKENGNNVQNKDEALANQKRNRPTPESVAMDRGVQNVQRKAHKNSKGDDKKLG